MAVRTGDYNGTRIELFIDLAIRNITATIDNKNLMAEDLQELPLGVKAIRTQQLMNALKDSDALGELNAWIVDELAHLRRFSKALSILAAEAEG